MYSLVMLTALSTAPATPQFDGYFRDLFRGSSQGTSCQGSCTGRDVRSGASCQGSCHGSCHGGGGLFQGRVRDFFSNLFDGGSCRGCQGSCHGCQGSCHGSCQGSCNGRGREPAEARGGCTGCFGGCVGSTPLYMGSCFGSTPNYSCMGSSCMGGGLPTMSVPGVPYDFARPSPVGFGADCNCLPGGVTGGPFGTPGLPPLGDTYPTIPSPGLPMPPRTTPDGFDNPARPAPADRSFKVPADDDTGRGRVRVRVPADAKLFVEGRQLSVTEGERTFVTPPLPADREAVYTFKVEYTRDGDTVTQSRKVKVKAGATTVVDFSDLTTAKGDVVKAEPPTTLPPVPTLPAAPTDAVKPMPAPPTDARTTSKQPTTEVPTLAPPPGLDVARITVKLPQGATLFVNGGKNERSELVREFTTPTLTPNKTYRYTMRAELVRNGLPEYQESKVEFRAGDTLTVDFTSLADPPADRRAAK